MLLSLPLTIPPRAFPRVALSLHCASCARPRYIHGNSEPTEVAMGRASNTTLRLYTGQRTTGTVSPPPEYIDINVGTPAPPTSASPPPPPPPPPPTPTASTYTFTVSRTPPLLAKSATTSTSGPAGEPWRRHSVATAQKPRTRRCWWRLIVAGGEREEGRRGGREEARVGRGRARVGWLSLLSACNFPDIFPVNFPLHAGSTAGEPPDFSHLARTAAPFHAVRTYRLPYWPEPRSRISDRRRHRALRRETGRIRPGVLSPSRASPTLFEFPPTRRQVRRNKREKCDARSLDNLC